jgi:hypothetical protein
VVVRIEVIGFEKGVVVLSNSDSIDSDMAVVVEAKRSTLRDQQRVGYFVAWVGKFFAWMGNLFDSVLHLIVRGVTHLIESRVIIPTIRRCKWNVRVHTLSSWFPLPPLCHHIDSFSFFVRWLQCCFDPW